MLDLEPIKTRLEAGATALAVAGNIVLRNDDGHEGNPLDASTRLLVANAPTDLAALVAEVERLRAALQHYALMDWLPDSDERGEIAREALGLADPHDQVG